MGAEDRVVAVPDETCFVRDGPILELKVVDPAERMNEGVVGRSWDEVMRLGVKLRMHLVDHRLPELR